MSGSGGAADALLRVSFGELTQTVWKACEGAGMAPGHDRDAARAVTWLEARGLGGVAMLRRDLPGFAGSAARPLAAVEERAAEMVVAAGGGAADGASALLLGGAVLDLLAARVAASGRWETLRLRGCRSPAALLPEGERRAAASALALRIAWRGRAGLASAVVRPGGVRLAGPGFGEAGPVTVHLGCGPAGAVQPPRLMHHAMMVTQDELEARHGEALRAGILLAPSDWQALKTAAARILVPASPRSRTGAGPEVDDGA